jgi:pyruvate/2-oxoglutarate dehydrogenase complex dihydrolipoamide dehydrogenase (E3) component
LETSAPGVYTLGDVKGGPAFTHISYDDFRIIRTNLLEGGSATITNRQVPYTMFKDPDVLRFAGRRVGRDTRLHEGRRRRRDRPDPGLRGARDRGGEIMAMIQIAMLGKIPYRALRNAVFAHPTLAESLNTLFSSVEAR